MRRLERALWATIAAVLALAIFPQAQISIANNAAEISNRIVMLADGPTPRTVTNLFTFSRSTNPPFAVNSGAAKVTNLDADLLDGQNAVSFLNYSCTCRLTGTTGVPVTTADVITATVFFTPYGGSRVVLYDGASWGAYTFTEQSVSVTALALNTNFDIFVYLNAGVPTIDAPTAWTNDTTRATALTTLDGVLVKSGTNTRRYVGTIRTTGANVTEDSLARRFIWNYYNRVPRPLRVNEGTDTWTYTLATFRQANAVTNNQLDIVVGVADVPVFVSVDALASNSTGNVAVRVGIGQDSTTAIVSGSHVSIMNAVAANANSVTATFSGFPPIGRHFYTWLEYSAATGTTTWSGDGGTPTLVQTGIWGWVEG